MQKHNSYELDLRWAKASVLFDDVGSWPSKGNLLLDGFEYGNLDARSPLDIRKRISWLRSQPDNEFHPQPYEQLAKVLRKVGRDEDARKIQIAKNRDYLKFGRLGWWRKIWPRFLGIFMGFGYRPFRPLIYAAIAILIGWGLFYAGGQAHMMAATENTGYIGNVRMPRTAQAKAYPEFNSLVYSLDAFIPLIDLHQTKYWLPMAGGHGDYDIPFLTYRYIPISGSFLYYFMCFEILVGWLLTSLFVVGLTGLLRQ